MNPYSSVHNLRNGSHSYGYRADIDGLRAVAVGAVIIHHFFAALLPGGFLGVDIFFVVSGYVITTSLMQQPQSGAAHFFLGFYARRAKRILPALIACVVVTCLVGALFIPPDTIEYEQSIKAGIYSLFGLSNLYFYKHQSDYFSIYAGLNLFTHTWSLGVEEQFYLVFPILMWASGVTRNPRYRSYFIAALVVVTALSAGLFLLLGRKMSSDTYYLMPPRFWELSIGCLIAVTRVPIIDENRLRLVAWCASGCLLAALLTPPEYQLLSTPLVVAGTALLIAVLRSSHPVYALLTHKYAVWIGLISYSLYLWHWSVLVISRWTIGIHWWTVPFQFGAMLALAATSFIYIERPLRLASWSRSRIGTIGIGVLAVCFSAGALLAAKGSLAHLYTGDPVQLISKGSLDMPGDKGYNSQLQWRSKNCTLTSNADVGKKIGFDDCTLSGGPSQQQRQFLVIGNSFAVAEFEMFSVLSERGMGSVSLVAAWNATPVRELTNTTWEARANDYYWNMIVPTLLSRLRRGDVLIMIFELDGLVPSNPGWEIANRLVVFESSLKALSQEMAKKGVQVIFQSQIPFLREAQCTPDMAKPQWFHMGVQNSCIYYTRAETLARIRPLQNVLLRVRHDNSNFHILDLFSFMCGGDVCRYYNDAGLFLYRDIFSHMSIEAATLLRPTFLSVVNEALSAAQAN